MHNGRGDIKHSTQNQTESKEPPLLCKFISHAPLPNWTRLSWHKEHLSDLWCCCWGDFLHQENLEHPTFGQRRARYKETKDTKANQQCWAYDQLWVWLGYCTALISTHEFKVSLDALTENWHCLCPAVSMASNQGFQLLAVVLFIIVGPQDKQKRSPIVLSIGQKCLISLFIGCSLQLFLNKIFSNINKFKFQNSKNQFPGICIRKQLTWICLLKFQLCTKHFTLLL